MDAPSSGPAEGSRVRTRTRSSTHDSTELDYSSVFRVEDDISTRIRSLLLSRHNHRPPRTPSPSAERLTILQEDSDLLKAFDFSSAKSIAKQARLERLHIGRLSLPAPVIPLPRIAAEEPARRPSEPAKLPPRDSQASGEDTRGKGNLPSARGESRKIRFPRLVLVDQAKPDKTVVRSCFPGPKHPGDDQSDPCDLPPSSSADQGPRLVLEDKAKYEGFAANESTIDEGDPIIDKPCPPDCDEKHLFPSLPHLTMKQKHHDRLQDDIKQLVADIKTEGLSDLTGIGEDLEKLSLAVTKDVKHRSHDYPLASHDLASATLLADRSSSVGSSEELQSHRKISKELANIVAQSLSSLASRNHSRPRPDPRPHRLSSDSLQKNSAPLLLSKTKHHSPSLLSGASRSSARHALLKPTGANAQPVDTGLPIPPVLTPVDVVPPKASSQSLSRNLHQPSGAQSHESREIGPQHEPNIDHWRHLSARKSYFSDSDQDAVGEHVQDGVSPIGRLDAETSSSHKISFSSAEMQRNAIEEDMSQASLYNGPPTPHRVTSNTDINISHPTSSKDVNVHMANSSGQVTDDHVGNLSKTQHPSSEHIPNKHPQAPVLHSPNVPLTSHMPGDDETLWAHHRLLKKPSEIADIPNNRPYMDNSSSLAEASQPQLEGSGSRRVSWFQSLLPGRTSMTPYQGSLTAMPRRTRKSDKSNGHDLPATDLANGVDDRYAERTPKPRTYTPRQVMDLGPSQSFAKTITDLEHLLNEALFIARLAVDKQDAPSILGTAAALLKDRRENSGVDSVHESAHSFSVSGSDGSEFYHHTPELSVTDIGAVILQTTIPDNVTENHPAVWPRNDSKIHSGSDSLAPKFQNRGSSSASKGPTPPRKNTVPSTPERYLGDVDPAKTSLRKRSSAGKVVSQNSGGIFPDVEEHPPITINTGRKSAVHPSASTENDPHAILTRQRLATIQNAHEVRKHIRLMHQPPIQPRSSSRVLRKNHETSNEHSYGSALLARDLIQTMMTPSSSLRSLDGPLDTEVDFSGHDSAGRHGTVEASEIRDGIELKDLQDQSLPKKHLSGKRMHDFHHLFDLKNRSHVSLKDHRGFSLARSHHRQPIARDWSPSRKRFVASVACISTALIGILVGIYAGEVPSIQYYIADFHHYTILGNMFFFIGLAIPTMYFWPLPLMHGRKPYTLAAMSIAMPLLFPQAIAVGEFRSPYVRYWRVGLLLPRAFMGFALGFANMNFKNTLLDLFGASLQSGNPHQEIVDEYDVRRHGGGMGVWLGIWTWCSIGSIGVGFLIGAAIINSLNPAWGFYISIIIIAAVLLLNVVCPEVRRSAFRRSVAEFKTDEDGVSRRLARGEVKMHRVQDGPTWWGQEVHHGMMLSQNMLRQPGFLVMALYVAWIYAQIVLIIVLLGSLMSKYYRFKSPEVGASVSSVPIGVLLSVPFSKASLFSRARHNSPKTNSMTIGKKVHMSSHVIRRAIFTLVLPFAGMAYTISSNGPPIPFIIPIIFAGLIGFLSGLAIAECHGLIMENYDTSDLQSGMTGRPRGRSGDKSALKRTNYSSFPRVSSALALTQGLGYLLAAVATGVGGVAQRHLGQEAATGVMAGILLLLTFLLLGVLLRFKEVQIIPDSKKEAMERWKDARRASIVLKEDVAAEVVEPWRPVVIGNPTGTTRRMSVLESGSLSRWSEIRKKNRLIDERSLEAKHPNLATLGSVRAAVKEEEERVVERVREEAQKVSQEAERAWGQARATLSRGNSRRSIRTSEEQLHAGDLGGNVEVMSGWRSSEERVVSPTGNRSAERSTGGSKRVSEIKRMGT